MMRQKPGCRRRRIPVGWVEDMGKRAVERVAFQGELGAFSQEAVLRLAGERA